LFFPLFLLTQAKQVLMAIKKLALHNCGMIVQFPEAETIDKYSASRYSLFFVGWVEVTKPFDYAVPAVRLRSLAAEPKGRAGPTQLGAAKNSLILSSGCLLFEPQINADERR